MRTITTVKKWILAACFTAMITGNAQASDQLQICVTPNGGPMVFVSAQEPLPAWTTCVELVRVVREALNTPELTLNPSVGFDYALGQFTRAKALHRVENTLPGGNLYITDKIIDGRTLVYSLASRRFFLANLKNPDAQLMNMREYRAKLEKSNGQPIYYTTASEVFFDRGLKSKGVLRLGRMVIGLGDFHVKGDVRYQMISCLNAGCEFKTGWVAEKNLSQLHATTRTYSIIPKVAERPIDFPVKQCGPAQSETSVTETEVGIGAELNLPIGNGIKLSPAIKSKLQETRKRDYPKDVEVVWTVFTLIAWTKYEPLFVGRSYWQTEQTPFVAIQETILRCGTENTKSRYLVVTDEAYSHLGDFESDLSVKNTAELNEFLAQLRAKLANHVEDWKLRNIAVSMSARG